MIQWNKYFDKIICINFNEFKLRHDLMESELKRVGILDSGIFEWFYTYNGPYQKLFNKMLTGEGYRVSDARMSCIMGHYNAIKKAYYEGCKNVLIIEDDERFLRKLDKIEQILECIPEDYNLILFDYFITSYSLHSRLFKNPNYFINQKFIKIDDETILSAGCYMLDKKGMETLISVIDMDVYGTFDGLFNKPMIKSVLKRAIPKTPPAIQVIFSKGQSTMVKTKDTSKEGMRKAALAMQNCYKNQNLNFDNYMMRIDGAPYYYGDYIEE